MNGWHMAKGLGVVLFLMLGSLSFPTTGWALSCAEPQPVEQAFEDADAVFKGIVMEHDGGKFVIQVDTVYKGDLNPRTVVKDTTRDWLQETLKEDGTYLIYGYNDWFHIEVSPCGRTDDWAQLKTDVEMFPNGEQANYDEDDYLEDIRNRRLVIASAIAGLLLLTGAWVFWRHRRNTR